MVDALDHRRAHEPGRGRTAASPGEIPRRGWKDVLFRLWTQMAEDHVGLIAAGVAFYSLLALFPLLAAFVAVYGLAASPADIAQHLKLLAGVLPTAALDILSDQLAKLSSQEAPKLGLVFAAALLFSLWSANRGVSSMFEAMNIAYGESETRGYVKLYGVTLLFTFGFVVFLVLALLVIVAVPPLLNFLGLAESQHWLISLARWPILLVLVVTANAVVYRYGPARERARWQWVSWGGVIAALLWIVASALFSFYAANFASYNETYGSMGAVVALMTWIWLSAYIIIAGAELNAELEHQTARDTTTGRERPLGVRGAQMADSVGKAHDDSTPSRDDRPRWLRHDAASSKKRSRDAPRRRSHPVQRWLLRALLEKMGVETRAPSRPSRPTAK
jgi:membrane protein